MLAELSCLMVATSYPEGEEDWRGRFIFDMAQAVGQCGSVDLTLWAPPGKLPSGVRSGLSESDAQWLRKLQARGGIAHLLRTTPLSGVGVSAKLLWRLARVYRRAGARVAHVNWLQNAIPLLGTTTPALVTVLGSDFAMLKWPGMKALLRLVWRTRPTILAPNASWMVSELEHAFGDVAQVRAVPFGVDARWFAVDRHVHVPRRWMAVTRLTRAKIGHLIEWGDGVFSGQDELHLFGPMQEQVTLPSWIQYHGPTYPQALRESWFPTATGLISLSRHDEGRPQAMLEAMASGLPVVASDIPAHRDFVRNGVTGYLIATPTDLREVVRLLADSERNCAFGMAARQWVDAQVGSWDHTAARYVSLYEELLKAKS